MAEIPDPFGRLGNFLNAEFETLSNSLKSAVGAAVKFASDQSKASASSSADLGKNYDDLRKALQELGDDIEDNLKSNKTLVDEIGKLAESVEKRKEGLGKGTVKDESSSIQREQLNVLNMILKNQQKAIAEKVAKFSPGVAGSPKKGKASLESIGFKPRGTDTVPAMLSPGEIIVNRRGAQKNRGVLDRINRGYKFGGEVKPVYLKTGSDPAAGKATGTTAIEGAGSATVKVEIKAENLTPSEQKKFENIGAQISAHVEEGLKGGTRRAVAAYATGLGTALLGGLADFMQTLFGGGVSDAVHFRKEMREIAFQTQGITGDFRDMQSSFANLGTNIVSETGKSVDVLQRTYMANLKKGFKDQKAGLNVIKSGLFLSTMIGSEAEQTANLFGDWHRSLGLSSNEMEKMARDMRSVSLSTGVTGDDLLDAMKSSEGILKNMRNQGNLTSDATKSIVTMMAEAKKTGFEEVTSKVVGAMSSATSMHNADSSTRGLIYTVARQMGGEATNQVQQGTFLNDRSNLAGFSKGLMDMVGRLSDGAVQSIEDFDKLSDKERFLLSMRLKNYGLEIGEAKSLIEQTKKAGMGLKENLAELDKLGSKKFATEEEKKLVEKQKDQLVAGAAADYLSAIREKSSGDESLSDVMSKMASDPKSAARNKDFAGMAGALTPDIKKKFGISGTEEQMAKQMENLNNLDKAKVSALVQNQSLMKAAKEQGRPVKDLTSEIMAMSKNNSFNKVSDAMGAYSKELAVAEANAIDPQKELVLTLNQSNETIRGYTSSLVGGIMDAIGGFGLLLVQAGIQTATLGSLFGRDIFNIYKSFGKNFGSVGSKFDDFIKTISSSDKVGNGLFKQFFKTFSNSRTPSTASRMIDIAEFRKFRKQGLSALDAKKAVEKMGGFSKGKGVFSSLLDATDELGELGDGLKKSLVDGVETVGRKGNIVFNRIGKRINLFGGQLRDSFSGAVNAFKNARTGYGFSSMGGTMGEKVKTKGLFSSLKDAGDEFIKGMTGKANKISNLFETIGNSKVVKSVKGAFDVFKNARKGTPLGGGAFGRGPRAAKGVFSSLTESVDFFIGNMTGKTGKVSAFFEKITSMFSTFFSKLKSLKLSSLRSLPRLLINGVNSGIGGMVRGVKSVIRGGVGGIFKGIGTALKGGSKLVSGGLRAALLGGTLGTAQLIFTAIDTVFGAVSGFMNTGKNFEGVLKAMGKSAKDLTWGMYASSTVAGALVGILDGLTFGLLSMTGAAEWLNQTLSLVFYTIFSYIEGWVEGIMGAFSMVGSAFSYIGQQFKDIGSSLLSVFNSIAGIFGAEAGNWSEAFALLYPWLKAIGRVMGFLVGMPIAGVLWLVVKGISAMLVPIQMLINAITGTIKIIASFIKFFTDIFRVGLWQATKNLGSALFDAVYSIFKPVVDFVASLATDIMAPFKWLYNILVGNSIVPDLCVAVVGFFGKMALNVVKSIGKMAWNVVKTVASLPVKAVKFVASLPGKVFKGLQNAFFKAPKKVFEKIFKHINTKTLRSGLGVISERFGTFFGLFKNNLSGLTKFFKNNWYDFLNASTGGLFGKLVDTIKNSKMYKYVNDFLIKPIINGLSWIGEKAGSIFKNTFDWIKGKVSNLIPGAKVAAEAAGKFTQKVATKVAEKAGLKAAMESSKAARFTEFKRLRATGLSAEAAKAKMGKATPVKDVASKATNAVRNLAKDNIAKATGVAAKVAEKTGLKAAMESSKAARFTEFKRLRATGLSAEVAKAKMGKATPVKDVASKATNAVRNLAKDNIAKATGVAAKVAEKTGLKAAMESSKAARFTEFKRLRATGLSAEAAKAKMGYRTFGVAKELANKGMAKATEMAPKTTGLLKAGASRVKDFAKSVAGKGGSKAATAAVSGVDDVAKAAGPTLGFLGKSSKLIGGLAKKLPVVGPLLDFGIRKVSGESTGKALAGTAAGAAGGMAGAATGMAIGTMVFPGAGTLVGGIIGGILGLAGGVGGGMLSDAIYDKVAGSSSANKAAEKANTKMESKAAAVATPVGQHAIPVVHPEQDDQINNVQPTHLNDISESILRDRAGSSGQTGRLQSDELSRIEEASVRQVEELEQIKQGITEMVTLLKPKGVRVGGTDEMGAGRTKDPRRPLHAAKFGKMKYGKAGGNANRSFVNDGES